MTNDPILRLDCISKKFGGITVVDGLSFAVQRASRTALIGPNGAGKTSVFNLISGVFSPDSGRIFVGTRDITDLASRARIRCGVARTFQNVRLMHHLSALENVILGQHSRNRGWRGALQPVNLFAHNRWREEARAGLADAGLSQYEDLAVGGLPYGVQRRIELVRAVMAHPTLLLLDEPAAGLNAAETEDLQAHLLKMCMGGELTLLVVEHDMHFVGALCDAAVVLSFGRKIAEGSPDAIRENPDVQDVYFGRPESPSESGSAPVNQEYSPCCLPRLI
ncbi:MAG: ABC transporter ATP-binding protein [Xanthobacteraceae bacterium]|jgi:ABC-type branched-subunit amino acid transport system ATPase component